PKDVIEKALLATREAAASNALFGVAALVGALMVQSLSKQQTRRAREIERSGPPVAAAWGVAPPGWPGQQPAGWGPSPGHLAPWGPPAPIPGGGAGPAPGQDRVPPPPAPGPRM